MTVPLPRPPSAPSSRISSPATAAVPATLRPMSRATTQRLASRASTMSAAVTPKDPASYTTVTSQLMLDGGGLTTRVMARSTR